MEELSDNEAEALLPASAKEKPLVPERSAAISTGAPSAAKGTARVSSSMRCTPRFLRLLVQQACKCKRGACIQPFSHPGVFQKLLQLRKQLYSMGKLDQDKLVRALGFLTLTNNLSSSLRSEVFDMLRDPGRRGATCLQLLGHQVCNKAFIRLLSLGKKRFCTLRQSAVKGCRSCPRDQRFIPKKKTRPPSLKRSFVYDFLDGLYLTVAEALPDGARNNKRPRSFMEKHDTPATDHQKHRAKQLPPGTFKDYLRLCQVKWNSPSDPISYKLFASETWFVIELAPLL